MPQGEVCENGVKYSFKVYQKITTEQNTEGITELTTEGITEKSTEGITENSSDWRDSREAVHYSVFTGIFSEKDVWPLEADQHFCTADLWHKFVINLWSRPFNKAGDQENDKAVVCGVSR